MLNYKNYIFDFDGVILDTEAVHFNVFKNYLNDNYNFNLTLNDYVKSVGADSNTLLELLYRKYELKIDKQEFNDKNYEEIKRLNSQLPIMNGVLELLHLLKSNNRQLFLCSSSKRDKIIYHLNRLNIIDLFDGLITGDDVKNIKPNPDIYLKAVSDYKLNKKDTVIIEDSVNGLKAGKSAGIDVIIVTNVITKNGSFTDCLKKFDNMIECKKFIEGNINDRSDY